MTTIATPIAEVYHHHPTTEEQPVLSSDPTVTNPPFNMLPVPRQPDQMKTPLIVGTWRWRQTSPVEPQPKPTDDSSIVFYASSVRGWTFSQFTHHHHATGNHARPSHLQSSSNAVTNQSCYQMSSLSTWARRTNILGEDPATSSNGPATCCGLPSIQIALHTTLLKGTQPKHL